MEKVKVFISKSGRDGGHVATLIKNFLNNHFSEYVNVFTSEEIAIGVNWKKKIIEVKEMDCLITLLDHSFMDSEWCRFEFGCFVGAQLNEEKIESNLYPIKIGDFFESDIIKDYQIKSFDEDFFKSLFKRIYEDFNIKQSDKRYKLWSEDVKQLIDDFNKGISDSENSYENIDMFHKSINVDIHKAGKKNNLGKEGITIYKEYWGYASDLSITSHLSDIGNALKQSERPNLHDKGNWKNIWKDIAEQQVKSLTNNLTKINGRTINIFDTYHITHFWTKEIMTRVSQTIWTTNLRGTNGRKNKNEFIDVQKKAIKRGVSISRVFVFSPEDNQDCNDLKKVIKEQLEVGILVYIITQENFNKSIDNAVHETTILDFMIIDNQYAYKTIIDRESYFIKELKFEDYDKELDKLNSTKTQIEKEWIPIKNIDDLSGYLN
ncbi:TIR domain-containing protein [Dokdonia sp.]|uniref:TIR domain-containing protein n=1 Tax=Dokdonia sp. TaxID=2024995 RepID=UPI003264CA38